MWWRWLVVIAATVIVLAGAFRAELQYQPRIRDTHQQQQPAPYAIGNFSQKPIFPAKFFIWVDDVVGWTDGYHDFVLAVANVFLAAFTLALFVATFGLLLFAKRQAGDVQDLLTAAQDNAAASASQVKAIEAQERIMREQAETMAASLDLTKQAANAAQTSADAATLHATAVIRSEMPVVRLHAIEMRDPTTDAIINAGVPPQQFNITVRFINHGRTTAFPFRLSLGHTIAGRQTRLPEHPVYVRLIDFEPGVVIRRDSSDFVVRHSTWITDEAYGPFAEMIMAGQTDFWFFGMLEFDDFLGEPHPWRFCVRWVPFFPPEPGIPRDGPLRGGFIVAGPANYRERQRGNRAGS
jgi:hypothetical protein